MMWAHQPCFKMRTVETEKKAAIGWKVGKVWESGPALRLRQLGQTMKALSKSELSITSNYVTLSHSVERMPLNPSNFKGLPLKPRC